MAFKHPISNKASETERVGHWGGKTREMHGTSMSPVAAEEVIMRLPPAPHGRFGARMADGLMDLLLSC